MEFHWFYKAWRIRAARDQKSEKLRKPRKIFCVFAEILEFHVKRLGFLEITILHFPRTLRKPMVAWSLFQSGTVVFKEAPHLTQKGRDSTIFSIPGTESALFGPESVFREPGSKTLYKRKVLGGFLVARNWESSLFTKTVGNAPQNREFTTNSFGHNDVTFAKLMATSQNTTFPALKNCPDVPILLLPRPFAEKSRTSWNSPNSQKSLGIE